VQLHQQGLCAPGPIHHVHQHILQGDAAAAAAVRGTRVLLTQQGRSARVCC